MTAGAGRKALTELVVTMLPWPAASIVANAARVVLTAASRLSMSENNQSSSVTLRKPPRRGVTAPTLLTRMSSRPCSRAAATRSCGPRGGGEVNQNRLRRAGPDKSVQPDGATSSPCNYMEAHGEQSCENRLGFWSKISPPRQAGRSRKHSLLDNGRRLRRAPDSPRHAAEVSDLAGTVEALRAQGVQFRNDIVTGVGGRQIVLDDPSGNPIELFEPFAPEARPA